MRALYKNAFFYLSHVKDTATLTLKNEIHAILSRHCLDIQNICGQGYDSASNMCGEWKGLQALVRNDCPYAYYVFCSLVTISISCSIKRVEQHYHFHIFNATIDVQLQELDNRFGEQPIELLTLFSALDPKDAYKSFKVDDVYHLVEKYYPLDFSYRDRTSLKIQLKLFKHDVQNHSKFQNLSSVAELCQRLVETEKSHVYPIIDRLIHLVLTLPMSTATGERAILAMKIVKTRLRNKMEDEFLSNNLVVYIEREIAENFTTDSVLDDFRSFKERRLEF
nr:uncharacterized protein LOC112038930 [Quercus suber]